MSGFNVQFENFPPGKDVSLRQIMLGMGHVTLLVEVDEDPNDPEDVLVRIITSNGPEHDEVGEFLGDMVELINTLTPTITKGIEDALDKDEKPSEG